MNKIIDLIFPMFDNYKVNKKLRKKFSDKENKEQDGILCSLDNADVIKTDILKQLYEDTFQAKDKFEDKAKANTIGITIAITLIMSASGIINTIADKYSVPVLQWIAFALFSIAVIYMLVAGLLAIKVLIDENIVYIVKLSSYANNESVLRSDYNSCIARNRTQNLIRNNYVYSSYECIRNALVCLFFILLLTTIPINIHPNSANENDVMAISTHEEYNIVYSSCVLDYLKTNDIQLDVEDAIIYAINNKQGIMSISNTVGIIERTNNLFIKFSVSDETITVLIIETVSIL